MTYEGGVAALPITISTPQATQVTFKATIVPINSINGAGLPVGSVYDFKGTVTRTMKINAGVRQVFLSVLAVNDALTEPDEGFNVVISQATPGIEIGRSVGLGTIKDATGAAPGQLLIGNTSIVEIDACATCKATAKFSVVLVGPAPASVKYSTQDAGATQPADYTKKTNATLSFIVGGSTRKQISVITIGDNTAEPTEGINVVFNTPVGVSLPPNGHIDILDND
jgi:hypothetical protein